MLFDDYVLKQIQKIAQLVAGIATRGAGPSEEDLEAELASAHRDLVGLDPALADRMDVASLARLLGDAERVRALALLTQARGDLGAAHDPHAASRLYERAWSLLDRADDPELRAALAARLGRG